MRRPQVLIAVIVLALVASQAGPSLLPVAAAADAPSLLAAEPPAGDELPPVLAGVLLLAWSIAAPAPRRVEPVSSLPFAALDTPVLGAARPPPAALAPAA